MSYILHLWAESYDNHKNLLEKLSNTNIVKSDRLTILSVMNEECYKYSFLAKQCESNKIELIIPKETFNVKSEDWVNTLKIKSVVDTLEKIDTEYVLILDGKDTCILNDLDEEFLNKFLNLGFDIVYNCQRTNYPNIKQFLKPRNEYINAGVCIGYKDKLLEFYKECYELSLKEEYISVWNNKPSEQYIIRKTAHNTNINISMDNSYELFITRESLWKL